MKISYDYKIAIESPIIRGIEEPRPWDITKIISEVCSKNKILLDIGCGTAFKLVPFSKFLKFIIGLDPNENLIAKAQKNMASNNVDNIAFVHGYAEKLPFPDNQFDIVTVILAPFSASEIHRVLKRGGIAIIEKIGDHDKQALKRLFGKDKNGWRGWDYSDDATTPQKDRIEKEFNEIFSEISIKNGFWKTYYSTESLIMLLEQTPTIRNFDKLLDQNILNKITETFMTNKGIKTIQNRLLIFAKK